MPYSLNDIQKAGATVYIDGAYLYRPQLIKALLSSDGKKTLKDFAVTGNLTKTLKELQAYIESRGGKLTISHVRGDYVYKWKEAYVTLDHNFKTLSTTVACETLDPKLLTMAAHIEKNFLSKVKKNLVFTIMQSSAGLHIESLGDGSSPLFKDNYTAEVLEDYNFIIESFKKSPPNGRIAILNGEPGTGKTHLIRSFLMELDCIFLIVPSNLISSMEKPDFLPLLIKIKNDYSKPIIMIVEDGDTCLVPRKSDNISTIAALLNLSDGILGSLIDIKMLISTNADIKDMDEAIMRPGRLCRQIHIGPLETEQANRVYQRITKDPTKVLEHRKSGYTLAEIYSYANNIDNPIIQSGSLYSQNKNKGRTIGFQTNNAELRDPTPDFTVNKKTG